MEIGGLADESAGDPVRIQGTISAAAEGYGQFWVCVRFGRNNLLILSTYLVQIMEPFSLKALVPDIDAFEVIAIKSRVHFRRGFDDNGFAKTILLVEPEQPFLGTTRLDKLPYQNVDLTRFYPYGNPTFSEVINVTEGRYRLIGSTASPYAIKLRALMRYRRIPHDWVIMTKALREATAHLKPMLIPVLQYPDGSYRGETTTLAYDLEARHQGTLGDPGGQRRSHSSAICWRTSPTNGR